MFRKLFVAALLIALGSATPVAAKDAWKHYYKEQEKRAKAFDNTSANRLRKITSSAAKMGAEGRFAETAERC